MEKLVRSRLQSPYGGPGKPEVGSDNRPLDTRSRTGSLPEKRPVVVGVVCDGLLYGEGVQKLIQEEGDIHAAWVSISTSQASSAPADLLIVLEPKQLSIFSASATVAKGAGQLIEILPTKLSGDELRQAIRMAWRLLGNPSRLKKNQASPLQFLTFNETESQSYPSGTWILEKMNENVATVKDIASVPPSIQKRWFRELSAFEKSKWLRLVEPHLSLRQQVSILGLGLRRLQQLYRLESLPSEIREELAHACERKIRGVLAAELKHTATAVIS